jgi:hypothetical protein
MPAGRDMNHPAMGVLRLAPSSLTRVVEGMHSLLRGDVDADELADRFGVQPDRLRIYQRFVLSHIAEMLQINFEVVHATVSTSAWDELTRRYFQQHPAWEYELNANAAGFPPFLAERAVRGELGIQEIHVEIAQLEWDELAAYFADANLSATSTPSLNPTMTICEFSYPVLEFVERVREALSDEHPLPDLPTRKSSERVLVFRDPKSHRVRSERATDDLLFAIKMVHDGVGCVEAARQAGLSEAVVQRLLQRSIDIGLVL